MDDARVNFDKLRNDAAVASGAQEERMHELEAKCRTAFEQVQQDVNTNISGDKANTVAR